LWTSLAYLLRDNGARVFYGEFQQATLWGKDLYTHLQTIYKDKAKYCVVFVSKYEKIGPSMNYNTLRLEPLKVIANTFYH